MNDTEAENMAVVLRYFDGCNSGEVDALLDTCSTDRIVPMRLRPSGSPPPR